MIWPIPHRPDGPDPDAAYARRLIDIAQGINRQNQVSGVRVNRTTRGDVVIPAQTSGGAGIPVKQFRLIDVSDDYLICKNPPVGPSGSAPNWIGELIADPDEPDNGIPAQNDAYYNFTDKVFRIFFNGNWSNMTQGDQLTYVAKPPELRTSLIGERILGVNHAYTYGDGPNEAWKIRTGKQFNVARTDTYASGTTETQRVVRPWIEQELIFAIPNVTTGAVRPKLDSEGHVVLDDDNNPILVNVSWLHASPSRQWAKKAS